MEVRSSQEAREHIESFAKRLLNLQQSKKVIDQDIKALKEEFKEEGVPVGIVSTVVNRIKAEKKKTDTEKHELEVIQEWLETNDEIDNQITMLTSKD